MKIFNKRKNIAFLCLSNSFGGLELHTLKIASELNKRDANSIVIVPPNSALHKNSQSFNLNPEILESKIKYGNIKASIRLARIFKKYNTDIVVIMQSKDINVAVIAKKLYPHCKLVFYQSMQSAINKRDFIHTWMYSHLSLWITLTCKMINDIATYTKFNINKTSVVPFGVDTEGFNPSYYDKNKSRLQFNIPTDKITIGVIGRLDKQKGQAELLKALAVLRSTNKNIYCVIAGEETVGETGYKSELLNLCEQLNLNDIVKFIPFTNNVAAFMSAIDIFVMPSYSETFGLVLVEAMAMQKAVISTNAGGVPEIIDHNKNGLIVEPKNVEQLAEAVKIFIDNEDLRKSLSIEARKKVISQFSMNVCIDKLVGLIEDI